MSLTMRSAAAAARRAESWSIVPIVFALLNSALAFGRVLFFVFDSAPVSPMSNRRCVGAHEGEKKIFLANIGRESREKQRTKVSFAACSPLRSSPLPTPLADREGMCSCIVIAAHWRSGAALDADSSTVGEQRQQRQQRRAPGSAPLALRAGDATLTAGDCDSHASRGTGMQGRGMRTAETNTCSPLTACVDDARCTVAEQRS